MIRCFGAQVRINSLVHIDIVDDRLRRMTLRARTIKSAAAGSAWVEELIVVVASCPILAR